MNDIKFEIIDKPEFKREPRYVVFKINDINKYLSDDQIQHIEHIGEDLATDRREDGSPPFNAVVVEQYWPEFDVVWSMIEARMTGCPLPVPAAPTTLEPVAVIGSGFNIFWVGSGPIAPIIEKHNLKVGDSLYAAPPDAAAIIANLQAEVERLTRERETWHGEFPKRSAEGMLIDQDGNLWSKESVENGQLPHGYKIVGEVTPNAKITGG